MIKTMKFYLVPLNTIEVVTVEIVAANQVSCIARLQLSSVSAVSEVSVSVSAVSAVSVSVSESAVSAVLVSAAWN